jgi:hypothetical protein
MRYILAIVLMLLVTSCTGHTRYGQCIGIDDVGDQNLIYRPSVWNILIGIIFVETIIVPLVVILTEAECPVAKVIH